MKLHFLRPISSLHICYYCIHILLCCKSIQKAWSAVNAHMIFYYFSVVLQYWPAKCLTELTLFLTVEHSALSVQLCFRSRGGSTSALQQKWTFGIFYLWSVKTTDSVYFLPLSIGKQCLQAVAYDLQFSPLHLHNCRIVLTLSGTHSFIIREIVFLNIIKHSSHILNKK